MNPDLQTGQTEPEKPEPEKPEVQKPELEPRERTFVMPDETTGIDAALGRSVDPSSLVAVGSRGMLDPAAADRERKVTAKQAKKEDSDAALWRGFLAELDTTRMVDVKLERRNARGEYKHRGSRENVDINELRNPDVLVRPYGGDYILHVKPAEKRFDDPSAWHHHVFSREGPELPDDWVIDGPVVDELVLEVEGMGTIGADQFKTMMTGMFTEWQKGIAAAPAPASSLLPGVQPYDAERERVFRSSMFAERSRSEERLAKLEEDHRAAEERARNAEAESERLRDEYRHKQELDALKTGMDSTVNALKASVDALTAKVNTPPPAVAAPQTGELTTILTTVVPMLIPQIRDIIVAGKGNELEALKHRNAESEHTAKLYRDMGEMQQNFGKTMMEMVAKVQDPSATINVVKMAGESLTNQMQLIGTMLKSGLLPSQQQQGSGIDWGSLFGQGLEMLGNIGATVAETKKEQVRLAASQSFAGVQPVAIPAPRLQALAPAPVLTPAPADVAQSSPLAPFVAGVNQAVLAKEAPAKIAEMIAGIAHLTKSFGVENKSIMDLGADPRAFLKQAYPEADPVYLDEIAQAILAGYGTNKDEDDEDEDEDEDTGDSQVAPVTAPKRRGRPPKVRPVVQAVPVAPATPSEAAT